MRRFDGAIAVPRLGRDAALANTREDAPPASTGGARTETTSAAPVAEPLSKTLDSIESATLPLEAGPGTRPGPGLPRLAEGEVVAGRFTVLRFLARGGMGEVYQAHDRVLGEEVALKTILGEWAADAAALQRFRREVQLTRRVSHPNVCRVHDLHSATSARGEALDFLTMEFLRGETLGAHLRRTGPLPPDEVLALLTQLAGGLDAAHLEGVVHRDFKASNVLLTERGTAGGGAGVRAVITDFGIARLDRPEMRDATQATVGAIGTPDYMAPEQVRGEPVGPAADIYALGSSCSSCSPAGFHSEQRRRFRPPSHDSTARRPPCGSSCRSSIRGGTRSCSGAWRSPPSIGSPLRRPRSTSCSGGREVSPCTSEPTPCRARSGLRAGPKRPRPCSASGARTPAMRRYGWPKV